MKLNFAEHVHLLPVLAPGDIVATATSSEYVELKNIGQGWLEFDCLFGTITATDSTGSVVVTVDASSDGGTDASPTAVVFSYRLSSAVATDSMGAITAAAVGGATIAHTDDNKTLAIWVDPAVVEGYKFARVTLTPADAPTATNVAILARFVPRYAQNAIPSST
jgi:hypothetical protein